MEALERHDLVELERRVARARRRSGRGRQTLVALPQLRGGAEVIERAIELGGDESRARSRACARSPTASPSAGIADRVIFDLGLVRDLGYYTGAIFEVYDPALGHVIGGGGRYDDLLGRFGRPLPGLRLRAVRRAHARRPGRGGAHARRRATP